MNCDFGERAWTERYVDDESCASINADFLVQSGGATSAGYGLL